MYYTNKKGQTVNISRADFIKYRKIQKNGDYNMHDRRAQVESGLNEETYDFIINNYGALMKEYGKSIEPAVDKNDKSELVGQIIDIFEDFLAERASVDKDTATVSIKIDNTERLEAIEAGNTLDETAILYGSDYGEIQTNLESLFLNWGIIGEEE